MKNKGFTLVELIGVITVLGIVILLAIPTVRKINDNSKEELYNVQINNIEEGLKNWAIDNSNLLPQNEGEIINITLGQLKTGGYIDSEIKNPKTNKCFGNDMILTVTRYQKNYVYTVNINTNIETDSCDTYIKPYIVLKGEPITYVELNDIYTDLGVIAKDENGNDITSNVSTTITGSGSTIDTSVIGNKYTIIYTVSKGTETTSVNRTVIVRDTIKPILTIPSNVVIDSTIKSFDLLNGVQATDNSGETVDIKTKSNISFGIPGEYTITYIAKDSSGNETTQKRLLTILPNHVVVYEGITNNGYQSNVVDGRTLNVTFTNDIPNRLNVFIDNTEIPRSSYTYTNGVLTLKNVTGDVRVVKGESVLLSGENFNKAIKNLVNESTNATTDTIDNKITFVGFYEETVPEGYTISNLKVLPSVSVSSDNRIKAYNDNGKVFVYSDNDIVANTNMEAMFMNLQSMINIDLSELDTINVTNMKRVFYSCRNLSSLGLKSFNTIKVTNMAYMFFETGQKNTSFILDLGSNFYTNNVENMQSMFAYTGEDSNIFTLNLGDKFNTSNVKHMGGMFCETGYMSKQFTLDLGENFDTSAVTEMEFMFHSIGYANPNFTLNLGDKFDTSNVTSMKNMFSWFGYGNKNFVLNLGNKFDTSNVKNMERMFIGHGHNFPTVTLNLGDKFDTSNVTNMSEMFSQVGYNSKEVNIILGNNFDTSSVNNMTQMFYQTGRWSTIFNLDLGDKFIFKEGVNVTDFATLNGASKLTIPSIVTNIPDGTFKGMHKLNEIVFEHSSTDTITLPTAGETTGAFYHSSNINTTVTTTNDAIKNYDWLSDNRTVTFK